jgi:hypothetical protein
MEMLLHKHGRASQYEARCLWGSYGSSLQTAIDVRQSNVRMNPGEHNKKHWENKGQKKYKEDDNMKEYRVNVNVNASKCTIPCI